MFLFSFEKIVYSKITFPETVTGHVFTTVCFEMIRQEFGGFRVLTVQLREGSNSVHCIYVKEHNVRERNPEKPEDRTLFCLGIPPYATEESLKNAFSKFDEVLAIYLHTSPCASLPPKEVSTNFKDHPDIKGFKVGYVVFKTSQGVRNVLSNDDSATLLLSTEEKPLVLGMEKWMDEYNRGWVNPNILEKEVEQYMEDYDKKQMEEEEKEKTMGEANEEGWTTVTKKSRKKGIARKESAKNKILKKEEKKRSRKELLNFYRFQIKESKIEHLVKLREKFAEDKKKVEMMKQARKFRPF